jgi:hypothetical protein
MLAACQLDGSWGQEGGRAVAAVADDAVDEQGRASLSTASSLPSWAGMSLHWAPPAPLEASIARPPAASAPATVRRHRGHPEPIRDLPVAGPSLDQLRRRQPHLLPAGSAGSCRRDCRSMPGTTLQRRAAYPDAASRRLSCAVPEACVPAGHQPTAASKSSRCCATAAVPGAPGAPAGPRPAPSAPPPAPAARRSAHHERHSPGNPEQQQAHRT